MEQRQATHHVHVEFASGGAYSYADRFDSDKAAQAWAEYELAARGGKVRSLEVTSVETYVPTWKRGPSGELLGHAVRPPRLYCNHPIVYRWDPYDDRCASATCGLVAALARLFQ